MHNETNSETRSYEGRVLPKQDEELVDQGLQFDLGTLSRRKALRFFGLGAGSVVLAACGSSSDGSGSSSSSSSSSTTSSSSSSTSSATTSSSTANPTKEIPDETAGPYPGDGSNGADVLEQSGVVRSDLTRSFGTSTTQAEGIPLTLELTITDLANSGDPFADVAVYVWHCDRDGNYSMYSQSIENENYLRGVQVADSDGKVRFSTIFPACYSGRWPHIHFEVYPDQASITDSTNAITTSQVALPKGVCDTVYATDGYEKSVSNMAQVSLSSDNVFGDDSGASQLATMSGDVKSGYTATLTVPVDTRTTPTGGAAPGGRG